MTRRQITVDYERCCGSGMCALSAPEVFDQQDDDGTVVLMMHFPPDGKESSVEAAVENCPCGAIALEERAKDGYRA